MTSIEPPPEFMPPSPFPMYEGTWTPLIPDREVQNPYVPIVSQQTWPDKQKFLDVVMQLENYIYQFDSSSRSPYRRIVHRGQIRSRLDSKVTFPVQEYWDMEQKIKWPAEYVGHYIGRYNVMPTKRFYDYIMYRMRNPFPGMPKLVFPGAQPTPTPSPTPTPPPVSKSSSTTLEAIAPPPEYGPPMVATQVQGNFQAGTNPPVPSQMQWPDKQRFVRAVERLEDYMYQFTATSGSPFYHRIVRCVHTSLLEPSVRFGCHHFVDTQQYMIWTLGYAAHYIGKWNVMPTKRFFDYVMYRLAHPFPQVPTRPTKPAVASGMKACYSKGNEPSPKGRGHCARNYPVGSLHRGKDRRQWVVAADKNGRKYWKRHTDKPAVSAKAAPSYTGNAPFVKMPTCRRDQIINPVTGRCVSKKGKIGRRLLGETIPSVSPPTTNIDGAGKLVVGEISTMMVGGLFNSGVEIPVTANFLKVIRTGKHKDVHDFRQHSNAYVFGPLFALNTYVKVGEHHNDGGETGILHVPRGQSLATILGQINDGKSSLDPTSKAFKMEKEEAKLKAKDSLTLTLDSRKYYAAKLRLYQKFYGPNVLFLGETVGGDVGASVYVHRDFQNNVDSLIIDSHHFFP